MQAQVYMCTKLSSIRCYQRISLLQFELCLSEAEFCVRQIKNPLDIGYIYRIVKTYKHTAWHCLRSPLLGLLFGRTCWPCLNTLLCCIKSRVKAEYSSSFIGIHLRAKGRHLPYGITQCYAMVHLTQVNVHPAIYHVTECNRKNWPTWWLLKIGESENTVYHRCAELVGEELQNCTCRGGLICAPSGPQTPLISRVLAPRSHARSMHSLLSSYRSADYLYNSLCLAHNTCQAVTFHFSRASWWPALLYSLFCYRPSVQSEGIAATKKEKRKTLTFSHSLMVPVVCQNLTMQFDITRHRSQNQLNLLL